MTAYRITDLIPKGKEHAISRKQLVRDCITVGLVKPNGDADRDMRELLSRARLETPILVKPKGGYYIPDEDDQVELQKYLATEEKRAKSIFASIKKARAYYEDVIHGRFSDGKAE